MCNIVWYFVKSFGKDRGEILMNQNNNHALRENEV